MNMIYIHTFRKSEMCLLQANISLGKVGHSKDGNLSNF
jgi:hypothetical protein